MEHKKEKKTFYFQPQKLISKGKKNPKRFLQTALDWTMTMRIRYKQ